ncbi:hypothetical protein GCM10010298_76780 [Streptomyces microflavus]|uniref:Uncharacterized protein n=1 Tax=Streptomyces microflavus TaxID=1919 RepID=A0A7J0D6B8_STRMI|nr:hypothetical protein Smic_82700 [Streptomyces microflavus]GGY00450.1 hypothetical protein GCM10010298_76780 [Streptomyces microflavus]
MIDPATAASAGATAVGRTAAKAVISRAATPLITVRAGSHEDVHVRCDAFEDALFEYFYHPTAEYEVALRQAHLKLARRCTDEPTRAAAWDLTLRVINSRDPLISRADSDALMENYDHHEWVHYTVRRRSGISADDEATLYLWIEEFHKVVRRGRLVRGWEASARWLHAANPARLFRRRRNTPVAQPAAVRPNEAG